MMSIFPFLLYLLVVLKIKDIELREMIQYVPLFLGEFPVSF